MAPQVIEHSGGDFFCKSPEFYSYYFDPGGCMVVTIIHYTCPVNLGASYIFTNNLLSMTPMCMCTCVKYLMYLKCLVFFMSSY